MLKDIISCYVIVDDFNGFLFLMFLIGFGKMYYVF